MLHLRSFNDDVLVHNTAEGSCHHPDLNIVLYSRTATAYTDVNPKTVSASEIIWIRQLTLTQCFVLTQGESMVA